MFLFIVVIPPQLRDSVQEREEDRAELQVIPTHQNINTNLQNTIFRQKRDTVYFLSPNSTLSLFLHTAPF